MCAVRAGLERAGQQVVVPGEAVVTGGRRPGDDGRAVVPASAVAFVEAVARRHGGASVTVGSDGRRGDAGDVLTAAVMPATY
ncbi:hypothetical protein [Streptomyces flaveolus]|uniref:hypothetical protein n=1 Tax=Streptomyces flaveolus TaxID=67297 RepID=UPI0033D02E0C